MVAYEEVLDDFGLALNASQKRNLFRFLDPDTSCIITIEGTRTTSTTLLTCVGIDFLVKLRGDLSRASSKSRLENSTPQNSPRRRQRRKPKRLDQGITKRVHQGKNQERGIQQ